MQEVLTHQFIFCAVVLSVYLVVGAFQEDNTVCGSSDKYLTSLPIQDVRGILILRT